MAEKPRTTKICAAPDCGKPVTKTIYCNTHYIRNRRGIPFERPRYGPKISLAERFWAKVRRGPPDECWEWTADTVQGYGRLSVGGRAGRVELAHRMAWVLTNGPIVPDTLFVCHRCDNPPCCNPAHLFLGTNQDNVTDMIQKGRQGTKLTAEQAAEALRRMMRGERVVLLAAEYGVAIPTIYSLKYDRNWKRLKPKPSAHDLLSLFD